MAKKAKVKTIKRSSDGGKMLHISPHPPDFVSAPWYSLIVRIQNPAALVTTVGLQAAIATQLGISFTDSFIDVRFQSVRLWGALVSGTTPLQPVNVLILDPIMASVVFTNRVLEQLTDYPDQVRRACIGYRYPKAQREVSVRVGNTNPTQLLITNGLGPNSVIYFRIQWRPGNTFPPTFKWAEKLLNSSSVTDDEDDDIEVLSVKTPTRKSRQLM